MKATKASSRGPRVEYYSHVPENQSPHSLSPSARTQPQSNSFRLHFQASSRNSVSNYPRFRTLLLASFIDTVIREDYATDILVGRSSLNLMYGRQLAQGLTEHIRKRNGKFISWNFNLDVTK